MKNPFQSLRRDNSNLAEGATPAKSSKKNLLENPWGISTVYTPPGPHKVDIFFTHGLGGGSRKTWSHDPCEYSTFWPGEWLPHEDGFKDARIHTFGYNANFQTGATTYAILDFAREFIQELWISPLNFGNVPIILVGHSMGGLVSKEMYIIATNNQKRYHRIVSAIKAMLFLAVPHKGSGHSKNLNKFLRLLPTTGPQQYINDLEISSVTIRTINELFKNIMGDLMVASLYEVIPMKLAPGYHRMIVDPNHAILGLENEIIRPMSANHRTICKFSSHDDPNYAAVKNVLRAMVLQVLGDGKGGKFAGEFAIPPFDRELDEAQNTQDENPKYGNVKGEGKEKGVAVASFEVPKDGSEVDGSRELGRRLLPSMKNSGISSTQKPDFIRVSTPGPSGGNKSTEEEGSCKHCSHCKQKAADKLSLQAQTLAFEDFRAQKAKQSLRRKKSI